MSTRVVVQDGREAVEVELSTLALRVLAGPDAGLVQVFEATPVVVGTSPEADLVLTDSSVSRRHLELVEGPDGLQLRDLGSRNGVRIGAARVTEAVLTADTTLRLGDTQLQVELRSDARLAFTGEDPGSELRGSSPTMRSLRAALRAAGPARAGVLLLGESGSGKELAARELHAHSRRAGPLVVFDASTADSSMLRSDLFGHVKGAFTGATADRPGAVREAHQGTLFLDEIGELPLDLQAHLLRVLEAREVTPVGADRPRPVDLRVVAATHRDLAAMAAQGSFRLDLFHRLAVVVLRVPPLRERLEDLPDLVRHLAAGLGIAVELSPAALEAMRSHPWTGNVRELRNVLERAAVTAAGRPAAPEDLGLAWTAGTPPPPAAGPAAPTSLGAAAEQGEREAIQAALEAEGGVRARAARRLGISVATLWRRMKRFGL